MRSRRTAGKRLGLLCFVLGAMLATAPARTVVAETEAPSSGSEPGRPAKTTASFRVAGFKAAGYSVTIDGGLVKYRSGPSHAEEDLAWQSRSVSEAEVTQLMERLVAIGVFDWAPDYPCVMFDGVWWSVEIGWNGRKLHARGANAFPPRFDEMQKLVADFARLPFGIPVADRPPCPG